MIKEDPSLTFKLAALVSSLENTFKYLDGAYKSLKDGGYAAQRYALEKELQAWIEADAKRKEAWGDVIPKMNAIFDEHSKTRDADNALANAATRRPALLNTANLLLRMAEERVKPDEKRDPAFQERNWKRIEESLENSNRAYAPKPDMAMYSIGIRYPRLRRSRPKAIPMKLSSLLLFQGKTNLRR